MIDVSLREFDKQNMYEKIVGFHKQIIAGIEIGTGADLAGLQNGSFKNIILAGMGGSAIGGDLLKSLLQNDLTMPFFVVRNYDLPAFADGNSLVICSSYSGNTEETLSAFQAALDRKCKILCITTGGELSRRAKRSGLPVVTIPSGFVPRAALGYSLAPLLIILGRLGFCPDYSGPLERCAEDLEKWGNQFQFESGSNGAFDLARRLAGKIVIIYSGPELLDAVAYRFKGQICENAKQLAFSNIFPEFNHNELVGWGLSAAYMDKLAVIILHDRDDHKQVVRRMDIIKQILAEKKVEIIDLNTKGDSPLCRMFSVIQLADYTSYYMALLNKIDPTPVDVIDYLKGRLAEI